jgi:hypothetical protein
LDRKKLLDEWKQWISAFKTKYNLRDDNMAKIFLKKSMPNMAELFDKIEKGEIQI